MRETRISMKVGLHNLEDDPESSQIEKSDLDNFRQMTLP